MKSTLFTIQVLGLLLFIPALVLLEFNHNKTKLTVEKDCPTVNTTRKEAAATNNRLADKDLLSIGVLSIYY